MTQALDHFQHTGITCLKTNIVDEVAGLVCREVTPGVGYTHAVLIQRKQAHGAQGGEEDIGRALSQPEF